MTEKKPKIKIVALDLDGTLLDSEKRLSSRNEKALRDCISQGVWIVPTTGRTWDGVPECLRQMPGVRYAITTNGAVVEDVTDKKVIDKKRIPNRLAREIVDLAEQFDVMYDPYVDGRGWTERRFLDHLEYYGLSEVVQKMVHATRDVVEHIGENLSASGKDVEKINFFFGDLEERAKVREVLQKRSDIIVTSSMYNNLEVNAPGATKGAALWRLADYLGVDRSETLACGDGENDVSMIQNAGVGVAMGNAEDFLKEVADYVTLTNEESGVAVAIEKFVLEK